MCRVVLGGKTWCRLETSRISCFSMHTVERTKPFEDGTVFVSSYTIPSWLSRAILSISKLARAKFKGSLSRAGKTRHDLTSSSEAQHSLLKRDFSALDEVSLLGPIERILGVNPSRVVPWIVLNHLSTLTFGS